MKKVVFFITKLGHGGAERVAVNLANKCAVGKKYNISVILTYNDENAYKLEDNIKVYSLPFSKNHVVRIIKRLLTIHKLLKKLSPDLVVSVPEGTDAYLALDSLINKTYALVMSQRQDPKLEYPSIIKRKIANFIYSRATRLVFQTVEQREFFEEYNQKKGTIILNPLKAELPIRDINNINSDIITFCRLEKEKNLDLMIEAFAKIHNDYPSYRLRIWGKGRQEVILQEKIKSLNMEKIICLEGYSKSIHESIKDAFLYINTSNHEGISNAMLESMAMGIPVICTDCPCGGARMIIEDKINGILIPVNDMGALIRSILEIIKDNELRNNISRNAIKIREKLNEDVVYKQWETVFSEAMEQKGMKTDG